jgi:exonuclease SbcD
MVKFAHISDVHLGGWKQQPMQELNFQSFQKAIEICISRKVDFVLISGDLFDSAYPSIDILKETFAIFKKLKEAKIPCFLIAGSHDYSVSGKTFLDVLEKAGFCRNVADFEERDGDIVLNPTIHKGMAIYGYPGKKSGLEIPELRRVKFNDSPGMFKIFMLHTTIDKAKGSLPIDALEIEKLPKADYYACGHLHIDFQYENFVYAGPVFPNSFQELEDLGCGRFYIVDASSPRTPERIDLRMKEVLPLSIKVNNALIATSQIISELEKHNLDDKIILLRLSGEIEKGDNSDIKFSQIEEYAKNKHAYFLLKNMHELTVKEAEIQPEIREAEDVENEAIKVYSGENPSDFNAMIPMLIYSLNIEKQEGETSENFTNRIMEESKKILKF